MSFDKDFPNRKDHRKAYKGSVSFDTSCSPNGSCDWCRNNRLRKDKVIKSVALDELRDSKLIRSKLQ